MGLRGQLWRGQGLAIVVWRRQLQGHLVVRQRHARWEVHLYTVMDVFFFDQPAWWCCRRQEEVSEWRTHYRIVYLKTGSLLVMLLNVKTVSWQLTIISLLAIEPSCQVTAVYPHLFGFKLLLQKKNDLEEGW